MKKIEIKNNNNVWHLPVSARVRIKLLLYTTNVIQATITAPSPPAATYNIVTATND